MAGNVCVVMFVRIIFMAISTYISICHGSVWRIGSNSFVYFQHCLVPVTLAMHSDVYLWPVVNAD